MCGVPNLRWQQARGVDPEGPEATLFGRKLVRTLTEAFGRIANLKLGMLAQRCKITSPITLMTPLCTSQK